ncbi:malto-oligosyltrehalose trehalohydrolase [Candidatus Oscillochloris fontis]|uniref:malto-oligosyltrehalose trehalohydrolase n=1 Tax=Candidatus Oscillochloris fontis TaxID=2496868 RepID=UPI00101CEE9D|nr:malto-oligosyltrehalose trehalohydrolase [Candidatus Oscillochloris fontis]
MTEAPRGRFPAHDSPPGATYLGDGRTAFSVWAPLHTQIDLSLLDPTPRSVPMQRDPFGYWRVTLDAVPPGTRYFYQIDGHEQRPDPASRCQPEGVHGPSAVVDPAYTWHDAAWQGIPLRDYVVYELHVGTFTPEGTFDAIIPHLAHLKELGISAIELMPVAHFPGERNWGYDGVYFYAPHTAYGGVDGLKRLVDACHQHGMAVILDVVYNHFGPEGNYLWSLARPFFTDRYHTPWGDAINYDGPESGPVRHFIIANALSWFREYHIDALRLDATHEIYDYSPIHILDEMADEARKLAQQTGRPAYLIAEGYAPRLVTPRAKGGHDLDAHWADHFHHALHVVFTGERLGYMAAFAGLEHLALAYRQAHVFTSDTHTETDPPLAPMPNARPDQFVVCFQNHDQVGNRPVGDRKGALLTFEQLKLAAGALLLAPFIPLLFMGEEYAEPAPFQFFTDHSDPDLVRGVREGRKQEFAAFVAAHGVELPDPQDVATFVRSKLNHELRSGGRHKVLRDLYRELLRLRRELPALHAEALTDLETVVDAAAGTLCLHRRNGPHHVWIALNFAATPVALAPPAGSWELLLDSAAARWDDPATPATRCDPDLLAAHSVKMWVGNGS